MTSPQAAGLTLANLAKSNKAKTATLAFACTITPEQQAGILSLITAGALTGGYESSRFKSKPKDDKPESKLEALTVLLPATDEGRTSAIAPALEDAVHKGEAIARGSLLTR